MGVEPNPMPFTIFSGHHWPGCWNEVGHHGCAIKILSRLDPDHKKHPCHGGSLPDEPQPSIPFSMEATQP